MSKKTMWILVIVLAALSAAVWWNGRRAAPAAASAAGGRLLPGVDLATVRAVALEPAAATTRLEQVDGVWCVAEKENVPADVRRLRGLIQALDETDDAQVADESADRLAEYGLAAEGAEEPLRIALEHAAGTTTVSLGKTRAPRRDEEYWGPPAGRYVRPRIADAPLLHAVSTVLASRHVTVQQAPFDGVLTRRVLAFLIDYAIIAVLLVPAWVIHTAWSPSAL